MIGKKKRDFSHVTNIGLCYIELTNIRIPHPNQSLWNRKPHNSYSTSVEKQSGMNRESEKIMLARLVDAHPENLRLKFNGLTIVSLFFQFPCWSEDRKNLQVAIENHLKQIVVI